MEKEKRKLTPILIGIGIQILITVIFVMIFSSIAVLTEIDYKYSPIFATVSVSIGSFLNALFLAKKIGNRGYLIGVTVGIGTFTIITLIGIIINNEGFTVNTLFHFLIFLLISVTGGIIGVNRHGKKYI